MGKNKKEVFVVKDVEYAVERPQQEQLAEAQKIYNRTYRDAIESGAIVRAKVEAVATEQKIWGPSQKDEHDRIQKELVESEKKLNSGGFKLSEARDLAIKISDLRSELNRLLSQRNSLDANTAEAQAENARFNRLVSLCTVYNETGKRYFSSYDEYLEKVDDDPVAAQAANKLMYIVYNLDPNFQANLPENKFLRKYKFIDEKLRYVDKQGKFTDREGRHVDEEGRYIRWSSDGSFEYVDRTGDRVTQEGEYVNQQVQPFLDDEGRPVTPPPA